MFFCVNTSADKSARLTRPYDTLILESGVRGGQTQDLGSTVIW